MKGNFPREKLQGRAEVALETSGNEIRQLNRRKLKDKLWKN